MHRVRICKKWRLPKRFSAFSHVNAEKCVDFFNVWSVCPHSNKAFVLYGWMERRRASYFTNVQLQCSRFCLPITVVWYILLLTILISDKKFLFRYIFLAIFYIAWTRHDIYTEQCFIEIEIVLFHVWVGVPNSKHKRRPVRARNKQNLFKEIV